MKTFPNKTIDLFIEQGTTFSQIFPAINAASYTFYAGIRKTVADTPFIDFTSTVNSTDSTVAISLSSNLTSSMKFNKTYIYSLIKRSSSGIDTIVAEGNVIVDPGTPFKTGV